MNFYINVPFSEKDKAKLLGARWDAIVRRWYYTEKQDALLFEKWFDKSNAVVTDIVDSVLLKDYVKQIYGDHHVSLTAKAAKAFGVPYPLVSGWLKQYGNRACRVDRLEFTKKAKKKKPLKNKGLHLMDTPKLQTRGPVVVDTPISCGCDVLPWEDCEHTEATAQKAMAEMLQLH